MANPLQMAGDLLEPLLSPLRPALIAAKSAVQGIGESALKGTKAPASQWYNQLAGKQGIKPAALRAAYGHLKDNPVVMDREAFLKAAKAPKLYLQKGYTKTADDDQYFRIAEMAEDMFRERAATIGTPEHQYVRKALWDYDIPDEQAAHWHSQPADYGTPFHNALGEILSGPELIGTDIFQPHLDRASELIKKESPAKELGYWAPYQRITPPNATQYYETVLRKGPQAGKHLSGLEDASFHFGNPSQIAHSRFSVSPDGHVYLEEVQSDPIEALLRNYGKEERAATPELSTPHADMVKAMLIQAAKGDAKSLSVPGHQAIGSVRGGTAGAKKFYESVYGPEGEIVEKVLSPLEKMGVPLNIERIRTNPDDLAYPWMRIGLEDPDLRKVLGDEGLPFKDGGVVKKSEQPVYRAEGGVFKDTADFLGLTSPATVVPGLAQLAEWFGPQSATISKLASLPAALRSGLMLYSPDTATDIEERAYKQAVEEGVDADWSEEQVQRRYHELLQSLPVDEQTAKQRSITPEVKAQLRKSML